MARFAIIHAGDTITCPLGHYICKCVKDLEPGTMNWGDHFGEFAHGKPTVGDESWGKCNECGAIWVGEYEIGKFGTHVNGQWRS